MKIRFRNYFKEIFTVIPTIYINLEDGRVMFAWLFWGIRIDY